MRKFLICSFATAIFLSGFLGLVAGSVEKAKAADPAWYQSYSGDFKAHDFSANTNYENFWDYSTLSTDVGVEVSFTNPKSISFWDFYSYNDYYSPYADPGQEKNRINNLATHKYFLFTIAGASPPFYLIVDDTDKRAKGIFRQKDGFSPKCFNADGFSQPEISCPWSYYQAESRVNESDNKNVWRDGHWIRLYYTLTLDDPSLLLSKYIKSVNVSGFPISTGAGGDCPAGSSSTAEEYAKCFFYDGGRFGVTIQDNADKPPSITIDAAALTNGKHRPRMTFTLKFVVSSVGMGTGDNYFYFVATNPNYPNLAIRLLNCKEENYFVTTGTSNDSTDDDTEIGKSMTGGGEPIAVFNQDNIAKNLTNKVYDGGPYSAGSCPKEKLNITDSGQLAKWGVERLNRKESTAGSETCGVMTTNFMTSSIAQVLCALLRGMGAAGKWLIDTLGIANVINAYQLPANHKNAVLSPTNLFVIQTVHAAPSPLPTPGESSIKNALNGDPPWVLTAWKVILGLADVFVVIVLLFLAVTNIMHLQYDTYAIKKALPTLIIGVILANFSILITKMLVDATNVLTSTFTGGDAGKMIEDLINAIVPNTGQPSFIASTPDLFSLILALLFSIFAIIAFIILGFLFYIRYIVILTLTAAAPLAFVLMAFPPTQGIFKQWWGWYAKFIFMKPISLFLVWLAWLVVDSSGGRGITVWAIAVFLVCAAIIVPFKMGGAIMGAWGALGKKGAKLAGKAAYDNPWAKAQRMKSSQKLADYWGSTRLGKSIDQAKSKEERYKDLKEENAAKRMGAAKDRFGKREGRETNFEEQVERSIGAKRVKEQVADLDLTSREGLAEAFRRMEHNKDTLGTKALVEYAATNGMVADLMQEANLEIKQKYGTGLHKLQADGIARDDDNLKTDLVSQQEFVKKVMIGMSPTSSDDLRTRNRIQEAWVKSGIANAKTIVRDDREPSGYRELNMDNAEDMEKYKNMTIKRFQSGHAQKSIQNLRKETLFDDDGQLTDTGIDLLGNKILTEEHVRILGRARAAVLQNFNNAGNIERLEAAGLTNISSELQRLGYGKRLGPEQIVVPAAQGQVQQAHISQLQEGQINDAVKNNIIKRVTEAYTPSEIAQVNDAQGQPIKVNAIEHLASQVEINPNFDPQFKVHVRSVANLRLTENQVERLGSVDATQGEAIVQQVGQTVQNEIGNALNNGIEISPIVNEIISHAKGPVQAILRERVKNAISASEATVISPGGVNISAQDIIAAHESAKTPDKSGKQLTEDQIKLRFIDMLASQSSQVSAHEMHQAWRLVETYEGKVTAKPTKKQAQQDFGQIAAQIAMYSDEGEEE